MVYELDKKSVSKSEQKTTHMMSGLGTISAFGYVFGVLFLLVGVYAYVYYKTDWIGWIGLAFYPYQNYALPLIIVGFVLLIVGFIIEKRVRGKITDLENSNQ